MATGIHTWRNIDTGHDDLTYTYSTEVRSSEVNNYHRVMVGRNAYNLYGKQLSTMWQVVSVQGSIVRAHAIADFIRSNQSVAKLVWEEAR